MPKPNDHFAAADFWFRIALICGAIAGVCLFFAALSGGQP